MNDTIEFDADAFNLDIKVTPRDDLEMANSVAPTYPCPIWTQTCN
ncbi:hypothetical protein [Streptomyces kronopolitis]